MMVIVILQVMIPVWLGTCRLRRHGNIVAVSPTRLHVLMLLVGNTLKKNDIR